MNIKASQLKQVLIATTAVLALVAAPVFMGDLDGTGSACAAAGDSGKGHQGGGGGSHGQAGKGGPDDQAGRKGMDRVLDADEDSDRPDWAGQPGGEDRPGGGGNPQPGDTKGDDYGDLIVLKRDPITGEPLTNDDGELLICLDLACTQTVPTEEGEVPAGVTPIEVEFGRAAVARSPSRVIDKALTDALAKLTTDGAVIGLDLAGRITVTINGVTSTIDSPLENLALYIDLLAGLADEDATSATEAALGELASLDNAASLLAGLADKTGTITVDYIVYNNVIAGVTESGEFYDYTNFSYTRTYPLDYPYFYTLDGGTTVLSATVNINDYLEAVNGTLPTDGGVTLFAAAADDALEVIELIHTQILYLSEPLPGTN